MCAHAVVMQMFPGLGATLVEDKVGVSFGLNVVFRKGGTDAPDIRMI